MANVPKWCSVRRRGSLAVVMSKGGAYVDGALQTCGSGGKGGGGAAGWQCRAPVVGEGGHGARLTGLAGLRSRASWMLSGGVT